MMGGAYFESGSHTVGRFNIYVDPEAADVVMKSGVPITMAPLDLTHRVLTTLQRLDAFAAIGNRAGNAVSGIARAEHAAATTKVASGAT
jgi:purine nucleosidase